jgi:hypothetical protein
MQLSKNCNSKEEKRMTLPPSVLQRSQVNSPVGMAL